MRFRRVQIFNFIRHTVVYEMRHLLMQEVRKLESSLAFYARSDCKDYRASEAPAILSLVIGGWERSGAGCYAAPC